MREEVLVLPPSAERRKAGFQLSKSDEAFFMTRMICPAPEVTYVKRPSHVAGRRRDPKSQEQDLSTALPSEIEKYEKSIAEGKGKQLMRGSVFSTVHHTPKESLLGALLLQWGRLKRSRGNRGPNRQPRPCNVVDESKTLRLDAVKDASVATNSNAVALEENVQSINAVARKREHSCSPPAIAAEHAELEEHCKREKRLRGSGSAERKRGALQQTDQQEYLPSQCVTRSSPGKRMAAPDQATLLEGNEPGKDFSMPTFVMTLSRKELEEDFLIFKGSKLPKRPKRRPKAAEKALQNGTPGYWLSNVCLSRYTVKEKKCVKGKLRGLKALESMMDSE